MCIYELYAWKCNTRRKYTGERRLFKTKYRFLWHVDVYRSVEKLWTGSYIVVDRSLPVFTISYPYDSRVPIVLSIIVLIVIIPSHFKLFGIDHPRHPKSPSLSTISHNAPTAAKHQTTTCFSPACPFFPTVLLAALSYNFGQNMYFTSNVLHYGTYFFTMGCEITLTAFHRETMITILIHI